MSVIIISLVLLGSTAVLSMDNYFSRSNVLDTEYKRISFGLAESCANVALLKIAQDPNYSGNEVIPVGSNNCTIGQIVYNPASGYDSNNQKVGTIVTSAQFPTTNGAFSNMTVSATRRDPEATPPSYLTVRSYVFGGTKLQNDFAPYKVDGNQINLDTPTIFPAGGHVVTQNNQADYNTTYSADCDASGNVNIGFNDNKTCVIINTYITQVVNLTVIADVVNNYAPPTEPPSHFNLRIDGNLFHSGQSTDLLAGNHNVSADGDPDYTAGPWGGDCDAAGNITLNAGDSPKTCIVTYSKNPPPSPICADTVMMLDRTGSMFDDP